MGRDAQCEYQYQSPYHHDQTIKREIEKYDMKDEHDKKKFEEKYRKIKISRQ